MRTGTSAMVAMLLATNAMAGTLFEKHVTSLEKQYKPGVPGMLSEYYGGYFQFEEFRYLWDFSQDNEDAALAYFADRSKPYQVKNVLAVAMQNLSAKDLSAFVRYCRKALELRKAGLIEEDLFGGIVFANARIWEDETEEVTHLLQDIRASRADASDDKVIDLILSGEGREPRAPGWPLR
jgi:hypothetical protein